MVNLGRQGKCEQSLGEKVFLFIEIEMLSQLICDLNKAQSIHPV